MCGRYLFSAAGSKELQAIAEQVRQKYGTKAASFTMPEEMYPSVTAPVLVRENGNITPDLQSWGLPGLRSGLVINARAETVSQRPMFRRSLFDRRCVIPTAGFYEWDGAKHKYYFHLPHEPVLYLAGIYDNVNGVNSFVILTTAPNDSMKEIHDRMPLVLLPEQVGPWLTEPEKVLEILAAEPPMLVKSRTDGQLALDDLA